MADNQISAEYVRQENQADPMRGPDHVAIIAAVAEKFGVSAEQVKNIMVEYTVVSGAG